MALVKFDNVATNKYDVEVSVDAKTFNDACDKAYKKNVKKINVPGFRVGKAPRKIIEKMYGATVFYDDAIEAVYPKALSEAIEEAKLDVIAVEALEPVEANTEKGLVFKATCVTKPVVTVKDYKGIKATKTVKTIAAAEVNAEIDKMRERNGRMVTVEDRATKTGDTVNFDFTGAVDGEPFDGGEAENYTLKIGSGQFIPGFEEQMVGKKVGEEFDVKVTFPEEYHAEDLKGKEAVFTCNIHEIKATELPAADDEFAKDVSEFDTLKELKADVKAKLVKAQEQMMEVEVENQLLDTVVENMEGEIPEVMYEKRIDELARDFEYRLSSQGMNMDMYMQYTGMDQKAIREQFRPQAEKQVKTRLALEKIVELENIEPSEEDIEAEYNKLAERYKMEADKVKALVPVEELKKDLAVNKAIDFLKENAEIEEVKVKKTTAKKSTAKKSTKKEDTEDTTEETKEESAETATEESSDAE
ncbi:MAG: trigger factor [Massilioclostridium sp.]|nr:MAG: trigger factor [Massilioclostridium sp.]